MDHREKRPIAFLNRNLKPDLNLKIISCRAKYFIAAPNLLRVGVEETVSIAVFDVNVDVNVQLALQDFPNRRKTFSQVSGNVRARMYFACKFFLVSQICFSPFLIVLFLFFYF